MVNTKALVIYLFILIVFNFFIGAFGIDKEGEDFDIESKMPLTPALAFFENAYASENESGILNFFRDVATVISFPIYFLMLVINYLLLVLNLMMIGFTIIPTFINVVFFAPLMIIIMIDYIIPLVRGN